MFWARKNKQSKKPQQGAKNREVSQSDKGSKQSDPTKLQQIIELEESSNHAAQSNSSAGTVEPPALPASATSVQSQVDSLEGRNPSETNQSAQTDAAPELAGATESQQEIQARQKNLVALAMRYAKLGEVVALLSSSPQYKHSTLADLEWLVFPAMRFGLFSVAEVQSKSTGNTGPGGVVLWAKVSDQIESRLLASTDPVTRLAPEEWMSGENIWVIATAGDRRIVHAQLDRLLQNEWAGKKPKLRAKRQDGSIGVVALNRGDPKSAETTLQ